MTAPCMLHDIQEALADFHQFFAPLTVLGNSIACFQTYGI